jgi:hypothetical protein
MAEALPRERPMRIRGPVKPRRLSQSVANRKIAWLSRIMAVTVGCPVERPYPR